MCKSCKIAPPRASTTYALFVSIGRYTFCCARFAMNDAPKHIKTRNRQHAATSLVAPAPIQSKRPRFFLIRATLLSSICNHAKAVCAK